MYTKRTNISRENESSESIYTREKKEDGIRVGIQAHKQSPIPEEIQATFTHAYCLR